MRPRKHSPQTLDLPGLLDSQICDRGPSAVPEMRQKAAKGGMVLFFAVKLWMFRVSTGKSQLDVAIEIEKVTRTFGMTLPYLVRYVSRAEKGVHAPAAWFTEAMHSAFSEFVQHAGDTIKRVRPPEDWKK